MRKMKEDIFEFKQSLENYFSIIQTKIELNDGIKKFHGKTLAPEFNSFNFWALDENKVSEILAFLLDPNETHNQGDVFLRIFINLLGQSHLIKYIDNVKVQCEFCSDINRRIDITLFFGNSDFIIGIENKIYEYTKDQNNQIKHYADYLKKISNDNYLLIYLAPQNKQISEFSISEENKNQLLMRSKFIQLSYEKHIINCIHEFRLRSESDRVRSFLWDFEKTLKQMYIGEDFMNENELILNYAFQNKENLILALKIGNAASDIKNKLYKKLDEQISEIGYELKIETKGYHFALPKWKKHKLSFNFEMNGLIYGITRLEFDKDKTRDEKLENALGGKWNVSNWWICWRFLYSNFDRNPENFVNIENGIMKDKIKSIVEDFIQKTEGFEL